MATRRQTKRAPARGKNAPSDDAVVDAPAGAPAESSAAAPVPDAAPAAPAVTSLGSALSIRTAGRLADELRLALASGTVRVDASGVEQVDTAGVQLLVATVATAGARAVPFEWTGVSPALHEAARYLGLGDALRLPATG